MLKCARRASLKWVSGLIWRLLDDKLLYSVIFLKKKLFLKIFPEPRVDEGSLRSCVVT